MTFYTSLPWLVTIKYFVYLAYFFNLPSIIDNLYYENDSFFITSYLTWMIYATYFFPFITLPFGIYKSCLLYLSESNFLASFLSLFPVLDLLVVFQLENRISSYKQFERRNEILKQEIMSRKKIK